MNLDILLKPCAYCGKPAFAWKRMTNRNPDRIGGIDPRRAVCYGCSRPEAKKGRNWENVKQWRKKNPKRWKAIQRADYAKHPERYLKHTRRRTKAVTKLLKIARGLTPAELAELLEKAQQILNRLKIGRQTAAQNRKAEERIRIGEAVENARPTAVRARAAKADLPAAVRQNYLRFKHALSALGFSDDQIDRTFTDKSPDEVPLARHFVAAALDKRFDAVRQHHLRYLDDQRRNSAA